MEFGELALWPVREDRLGDLGRRHQADRPGGEGAVLPATPRSSLAVMLAGVP